MVSVLLRDVEVDGCLVDVTIDGGRITAIGTDIAGPGVPEWVDGDGHALLPGLWDHHVHLAAMAAARSSVQVGPPVVTDLDGLRAALAPRQSSPSGWVRAVGYHDSVAGPLDRDALDAIAPGVPVRVQHRSGALWVLSSAALAALAPGPLDHPGAEHRDGRPTGRFLGADEWLRLRLPPDAAPVLDLADVGRELAGHGIVGVTDATPVTGMGDLAVLADAARRGDLRQRIVATGGPALTVHSFPQPLHRGPVKLLLQDGSLPDFDRLAGWIGAAHATGRPVAIHSVTRESLALALAALEVTGSTPGDRIEHGAVVPPDLVAQLVARRLTVVTQPVFIADRGDAYRRDVAPDDLPYLYPCASLDRAGVAVAGSSDAPFGDPNPWRAMAVAADRRTASGAVMGGDEAVTVRRALDLYTTAPDDPGGAPRRIVVGGPADVVLLDRSLADALADPARVRVRRTICAGVTAWRSD